MSKGIDISTHNGKVNFEAIKRAGYDFVIIRAGYGRFDNQKDARFEEHYAGAKAAGLNVGAYFYSYAINANEAEEEAKTMLNWIKGKQFEYPIYFDIEDKSQSQLSRKIVTGICNVWCNIVEKAGYYVGIYANVDWFKNHLDLKQLEKYDKWLAHWSDKPWKGDEFGGLWQFSDSGVISGNSCAFDLNESYRDYPSIIKKAGLNGFKAESVTESKDVASNKNDVVNNKDTVSKKYTKHTVVKGDCLWDIAQKYLGDGGRYREIKNINNLKSDTIYPGQILKVPVIK